MKFFTVIILLLTLTACSNQSINSQPGNLANVETGTVLSVRTAPIEPIKIYPHGNVGVGIGSGGYRGIFGSIDAGTIGRIFSNATGPKFAQEVIVKKSSGEIVAIRQAAKTIFKQGDKVKIIVQKGQAEVIH
jgi:outer membrane lipoprotein SlyB